MAVLSPTQPTKRIASLDTLRGFALFGVLVVNVLQAYTGPSGGGIDRFVASAIRVLGEGTFYPMFSFLFGLGFALQLRKGEAVLPVFRRRLFVLLGFGLVHGFLIWRGDILAAYALLGLLLPSFRHFGDRRLVLSAGVGWLLSLLLVSPLSSTLPNPASLETSLYATGDYLSITALRAAEYSADLLGGTIIFGGQLLGLFLLGYLVGRRGVAEVAANRPWLLRVFAASLAVALPIFGLYLYTVLRGDAVTGWTYLLEYFVASPFLGFAYLAGLSLLLQRETWQRRLRFLSPVGRMALSNYLGQSALCTLIFYGYGLGYYGQLGAATTLLISLGIFAVQVVVSALWLRFFQYGAVEWLWRTLTYGRVPPWAAEQS